MKTEEAGKIFEEMLIKAGFDQNKPNLKVAWDVFKQFIKLEVDCVDDLCFFECGVDDTTGQSLFCWDLVRQFEIEDADEDDSAEQLHFEVQFKLNDELESFEESIWSSDYDSLEEFIQEVEELPEFKTPIERYTPFKIVIYQEEI